jgi:hypothetical protein
MASDQELAILIRAQNITQQAFDQARKDLASVGQESQKTNQLLGSLKNGLGALGIAFSAQSVIGFAKSVFDSASEIHDLSEQLGISAEAVQGFKFAAEQSGSSLEAVGIAITKMNKNLATGDSSTIQALEVSRSEVRRHSEHEAGGRIPRDHRRDPEDSRPHETSRGRHDPHGEGIRGAAAWNQGGISSCC